MILVLLVLVICVSYYLYIRNHRYLSFGLGCFFFLWYGWYTSYSVFTFTHEPIIITSTTTTINNHSPHKQHGIFNTYNNMTWPITIDATQTNIRATDLPLIILNKNRITVNSNLDKSKVPVWTQSLNSSGLWSDIDYTSGCSATMTRWPVKMHLERVESMATVWYDQQQDTALLSKITQSLDYYFLHDFVEKDCLLYGGQAYKNCPCGTAGFWNQAWHYQGVALPRHMGNICLLTYQQLSTEQRHQCIKFTSRSYSLVSQNNGLHLLDIVYNGVSLALLKGDSLLLQDALDRIDRHIPTDVNGIQMDGSYLSSDGQLNNGIDGEYYLLDLLTLMDMMILASKPIWVPSNDTQTAFARLVSGSEWMMIGRNNSNSTNTPWLWQHGAIAQQTMSRSVSLNITQMNHIIQYWNSNTTIRNETTLGLRSTIERLNHTYASANQGPLIGTRYFWNGGYLVHRCYGFVTTLKMGLGCDSNNGRVFTYQQGTDDLDAYDWNHDCGENKHFVGATVLEQNQMGVAVLNFTEDTQKTFFFFPSVYAIQTDLVATNTSHVAMLDQRRRRGDIYLNDKRLEQPDGIHQGVQRLWHDKILYTFETPVNLTMTTKDQVVWTASITTKSSLIYTVQPNYGLHRHQTKSRLDFVSDQGVRGAFSASDHAVALAFWAPATINLPWSHSDDGDDGVDIFIQTQHPLTVFLHQQVGNGTWVASISDPTKTLVSTTINISVDQEEAPIQYDIDFPQGQMRGSSVMIVLQDEP